MIQPGAVLSQRYEVVQVLGQGGMGVVYLARHLALGTWVALKALSVEKLPQAELAAWHRVFADEARTLAGLRHPGLAEVQDFFHQDGVPYLVMEHIPGRNLEEEVRSRPSPPSWAEVRGWADQLLDVLEYLHGLSPPILIRDLNPRNVMRTPTGHLKLVDFGLARPAPAGSQTATILQGYGSEGYAPLEQYRGTTDVRSDLYALGATLLFCLAGQAPPGADVRVTDGAPLPPTGAAPAPVRQALETLLALVPAQRPAGVRQARALLGLARGSAGTSGTGSGPSGAGRGSSGAGSGPSGAAGPRPPARKPWWKLLGLGLLGLGAAVTSVWRAAGPPQEPAPAPPAPPAAVEAVQAEAPPEDAWSSVPVDRPAHHLETTRYGLPGALGFDRSGRVLFRVGLDGYGWDFSRSGTPTPLGGRGAFERLAVTRTPEWTDAQFQAMTEAAGRGDSATAGRYADLVTDPPPLRVRPGCVARVPSRPGPEPREVWLTDESGRLLRRRLAGSSPLEPLRTGKLVGDPGGTWLAALSGVGDVEVWRIPPDAELGPGVRVPPPPGAPQAEPAAGGAPPGPRRARP